MKLLNIFRKKAVMSSYGFQEGNVAYKKRDYKEALRLYNLSAIQGDVVAQYKLARMYLNGEGVLRNYKEGLKWIRLSAEQGYLYAQNEMGLIYQEGKKVSQDYVEALKW